jgi:predicted RNA-binding Zn-ribbon protein involved in translation (DUF1610 family)
MRARKYKSPAPHGTKKGQARVLILDIETAPILGNVWRIWKENVGLNQIERDWFILSYAAKWLGEDRVMYEDQSKAPDIENDKDLLGKLWKLLDEADVVVAHNGKKFDIRKINARMVLNGYKPYSPIKVVDTLEISKTNFAFTSNRLEYISGKLNKKYRKLKHGKYPGFELWRAVLAGDKAAWAEMRTYNEHDVLSLEETYLELRPWDRRHPNVDVYDDEHEGHACPVCGSHHVEKRGFARTNSGKYQRFQCQECGGWSRSRYTMNTAAKRKATLTA